MKAITLLLRYLLTFVTLIVAVCRTGVIYELLWSIEVYSHLESLWLSSRASEHGIRSSTVRFPMRTQNFSSSHARDKMKKHLSLFLYWAQNLTIFLFLLTKHDAHDIADPRSLQNAYSAWTSEWALPITESPWLSCRASERGVRRFEVRFSWGLRIFPLSHARDETKKNFFIYFFSGLEI